MLELLLVLLLVFVIGVSIGMLRRAPQLVLSRRLIPVPKHSDSAPWLQRFAISPAQIFQKRLALSGESLLKNRRFAKTPYNDITAYGAIRSVSVSV